MNNNIYSIVKMLGGFGEIHLPYDMNLKVMRTVKFEPNLLVLHRPLNQNMKTYFWRFLLGWHKGLQKSSIKTWIYREQLNKVETILNINKEPIIGIPKAYYFDRYE